MCAYPIAAQQPINNVAGNWLDRSTLTGDWGGTRTTLEAAGIQLRAGFTMESAANPVGGQRQTVQIAPWLSVRPNFQYVINPGGTGKIPNAFVIGLHTGVTF